MAHGKYSEHVSEDTGGFGVPGKSFTQWLNSYQCISFKSLFNQGLNASEDGASITS